MWQVICKHVRYNWMLATHLNQNLKQCTVKYFLFEKFSALPAFQPFYALDMFSKITLQEARCATYKQSFHFVQKIGDKNISMTTGAEVHHYIPFHFNQT